VITGEGLKTLDAVRGSFETYEVDPTTESFTETVESGQLSASPV
jgi:threonine synthase